MRLSFPLFFLFLILNTSFFLKDETLYIKHDYELLYSEKWEQAYYVKYTINQSDVNGELTRKDNFKEDKSIVTGSASLNDYKNSNYDRGHLKPAAVSKGTVLDMNESFLMSNMSPQLPEFNRQGWKDIESIVRQLLNSQDSVIVYTGGVLKDIKKVIGSNEVGVPNYFFTAVLLGDSSCAFAFLCPHQKLSKPYKKYIVSIDALEKIIQIDLFPGLNSALEN